MLDKDLSVVEADVWTVSEEAEDAYDEQGNKGGGENVSLVDAVLENVPLDDAFEAENEEDEESEAVDLSDEESFVEEEIGAAVKGLVGGDAVDEGEVKSFPDISTILKKGECVSRFLLVNKDRCRLICIN